jgi:hypothetical protein
MWQRGIKPVIARRQTQHGSGLGRERWVVERTFAWLHNRRRLLVRTDRRHETHEALLDLACCLICWRRIETSFSQLLRDVRTMTVASSLRSAAGDTNGQLGGRCNGRRPIPIRRRIGIRRVPTSKIEGRLRPPDFELPPSTT